MELIKVMVLLILYDGENPPGIHQFGKSFNIPKKVIKEGKTIKLICSEEKQLPFEIKEILWHEGEGFIRINAKVKTAYANDLSDIPFSELIKKGWMEHKI